ncbi:hypothetical protein CH72_3281 [Burkholderia ambifaria AMMD]|nr:hypothetical protein CH72_3281 [Burkholderia ambifaria AMMD]
MWCNGNFGQSDDERAKMKQLRVSRHFGGY